MCYFYLNKLFLGKPSKWDCKNKCPSLRREFKYFRRPKTFLLAYRKKNLSRGSLISAGDNSFICCVAMDLAEINHSVLQKKKCAYICPLKKLLNCYGSKSPLLWQIILNPRTPPWGFLWAIRRALRKTTFNAFSLSLIETVVCVLDHRVAGFLAANVKRWMASHPSEPQTVHSACV